MKVSLVEQMRAMDRYAIEELGMPDEILMENAGQSVYFVILKEFGIMRKRFIVFSGIGNNGGDGLVVARKIHSAGGKVKVFVIGDPGKYKGAARKNFDIISRLSIDVVRVDTWDKLEDMRKDIMHSDAIVDAIFGTGLSRDVEGIYRDIIGLINQGRKMVFSVDIPSGVNGDTGSVMGVAIRADKTITFGLPKLGNMLYPGYELCGKLYVSHISFPPSLYDSDSIKVETNEPIGLGTRPIDGHKGDFGDVLFIAGASTYFGAPYFSAMSFLKAGGGYSRLALPSSMVPSVATRASEIVFVPQKETPSGSISMENMDALLGLSHGVDMVVMGPGISLDDETQKLVRELALKIDKPLLIDGDGITAISSEPGILKKRNAKTILTPHPGEMSRLTGLSIGDIIKDRVGVLRQACSKFNSIIVLKGAHSLIGYPDERVFINMTGNSGMATAGSGDVLTGTIAAMHGLGLELEDAIRMGVFIHGLSGDLAAREKGEDGISARDIMDYLPGAMKAVRQGQVDDSRYVVEMV